MRGIDMSNWSVKINLSWADLEGADLHAGEHAVGETEGGGLPDSDQ
jgi:hypothetical protein